MTHDYTVNEGVYTFPDDNYQLRLERVRRDQYGRIYVHASLLTPDGVGHIAYDHGDITSAKFRSGMAGQGAKRNSGDTLAIENLLLDAFLSLRNDPSLGSTARSPAFRPLDDFVRSVEPPHDHVVENLIERGSLTGVASKPKAGKSLLLMNLGMSVACGKKWLGREVTAGRVLLFQLEDSDRTLKRRFESMAPQGPPSNFLLHAEPFELSQENYDATVEACQGASLVICDPIIQATNIRDWNAQQEVRDGYDPWRRLARDTNAAVIVSAHHRKMAGEFGDAMAGSIQAFAAVDGILELYRDDKLDKSERRISFVGRDWSDREDEVIRLNTEILTWELAGTYVEAKERLRESVRESERQRKDERVWDALPDGPPGVTYDELVAETELTKGIIRTCIKSLGVKVAPSTGGGGRGNERRFWRTSK